MKIKTVFLATLLVIGQSLNLFAGHPITPVSPDEGDGSPEEPYEIETLNHLYWIAVETRDGNDFADKYFLQKNNIDAIGTENWFDGKGWLPIGEWQNNPFSGNYDGGGNTISNLYIDRSEDNDVSFFGHINGATISNLGLTNVSISGQNNIAALTGYARNTTINNCFVSGSIEGNYYVGGISGWFSGEINNSYNTGNISGSSTVGGLVGYGYDEAGNSIIRNSYSAGSIEVIERPGDDFRIANKTAVRDNKLVVNDGEPRKGSNIGGLIGNIIDGTTAGCFWDVDKDGIDGTESGSDNEGATGRTTAEMKDINTFSDWDITGDPDIPADYPFLAWEDDGSKSPVWFIGTGTAAVPLSDTVLFLTLVLIAGFVFFKIYRAS